MFTRLVEENLQMYQLSTASQKGFPTSKQLPGDVFCLAWEEPIFFWYGRFPCDYYYRSDIIFSNVPPRQYDLLDAFRMHSGLYYFRYISSPYTDSCSSSRSQASQILGKSWHFLIVIGWKQRDFTQYKPSRIYHFSFQFLAPTTDTHASLYLMPIYLGAATTLT